MNSVYLGLDIGASSIKHGLVDDTGNIVHQGSVPSRTSDIDSLQKQCFDLYQELVQSKQECNIEAIGIGIPGFINTNSGVLSKSPNIPALDGQNVHQVFSVPFHLPVVVENDANAAAWGEYWVRQDKPQLLLFLTLGSGVGGGIVLNGSLWRGIAGYGAEFGHMVIQPGGSQCGCGNQGCLEAEFSIAGLKAKVQTAIESGEKTSLGKAEEEIHGRDIIDAALANDPLARELMIEGSRLLGLAMGNLINAFNPNVIVLGGGMTAAKEIIMPEVREAIKLSAIPAAAKVCTVEISSIGNDAGLIGAAGLAREHLRLLKKSG